MEKPYFYMTSNHLLYSHKGKSINDRFSDFQLTISDKSIVFYKPFRMRKLKNPERQHEMSRMTVKSICGQQRARSTRDGRQPHGALRRKWPMTKGPKRCQKIPPKWSPPRPNGSSAYRLCIENIIRCSTHTHRRRDEKKYIYIFRRGGSAG